MVNEKVIMEIEGWEMVNLANNLLTELIEVAFVVEEVKSLVSNCGEAYFIHPD